MRFLFLANESIELEARPIDTSVVDDKLSAIEMYRASIREYEAKIKITKDPVERAAYLKVIDALNHDIKKFATTTEAEQYALTKIGNKNWKACNRTFIEFSCFTATTTRSRRRPSNQ